MIGDPVTLTLDIGLHVNAQNMHDVGIFLSQDGKSPIIRSTAGGSASCGVAGIPMSPPPFANIDTAFPQNQCGDFDRDGFAQGYVARAPLGAVTLTCSPDLATGKAAIPAVVTWDPSQESSCSVPASLGAATGSKCEAKVVPVNVAVQGKITIVKTTSPPTPGSFPFSATGPAGFTTQNFTLSHGGSFTFPTLALTQSPLSYTVSETAIAGFNPTASISCTDQNGQAQPGFVTTNAANRTVTLKMSLDPLQGFSQATCTFTNTQQSGAQIIISKDTVGGDGTFVFSSTVPGNANFSITTSGGTSQPVIMSGLAPGNYTVTETVPGGWVLGGVTCFDPSGGTTTAGPTANISLAAGEVVACSFSDTKLATLVINEQTEPHSGTLFNYTATGVSPTSFTLFDDGNAANYLRTFSNITPGTSITVTEGASATHFLTSIVCDDANGLSPSTVNLGTRTATPVLSPGEVLTCTFTNTLIQPASITITKNTIGGSGSFAFSNSGGVGGSTTNPASFIIVAGTTVHGQQILTGLAAGTYVIRETVPASWVLTTPISCVVISGSNSTITQLANGVSISLGTTGASVDSVACTFVDRLNIPVVENVPTLSEWGMILMSLGLLGMGAYSLRRRRPR